MSGVYSVRQYHPSVVSFQSGYSSSPTTRLIAIPARIILVSSVSSTGTVRATELYLFVSDAADADRLTVRNGIFQRRQPPRRCKRPVVHNLGRGGPRLSVEKRCDGRRGNICICPAEYYTAPVYFCLPSQDGRVGYQTVHPCLRLSGGVPIRVPSSPPVLKLIEGQTDSSLAVIAATPGSG